MAQGSQGRGKVCGWDSEARQRACVAWGKPCCPSLVSVARAPLTGPFSPAADPLGVLLQPVPPPPVQPVPASSLRKCPSLQPARPSPGLWLAPRSPGGLTVNVPGCGCRVLGSSHPGIAHHRGPRPHRLRSSAQRLFSVLGLPAQRPARLTGPSVPVRKVAQMSGQRVKSGGCVGLKTSVFRDLWTQSGRWGPFASVTPVAQTPVASPTSPGCPQAAGQAPAGHRLVPGSKAAGQLPVLTDRAARPCAQTSQSMAWVSWLETGKPHHRTGLWQKTSGWTTFCVQHTGR